MVTMEKESEHLKVDRLRPKSGKHGILIVDDMALTLAVLESELEPSGFTVWLATGGNDAIDMYRRHQDQIGVVLLDVQMPGLDGPHTLAALRWLNPDIVACFMGGGDDRYSYDDLLDRGAVCVFGKPIRPTDVSRFLQMLLGTADSDSFNRDRAGASDDRFHSSFLPADAFDIAAVVASSR